MGGRYCPPYLYQIEKKKKINKYFGFRSESVDKAE